MAVYEYIQIHVINAHRGTSGWLTRVSSTSFPHADNLLDTTSYLAIDGTILTRACKNEHWEKLREEQKERDVLPGVW
jgi:hypothetical protein